MDRRDLRRALQFVTPYWRRLALVLALSLAEHRRSRCYLPLLSRDFFDQRAARPRPDRARPRSSALFAGVIASSASR